MLNKVQNVQDIRDQVRPHLRSYLIGQGIEINAAGKFKCIVPGHDDSNPSCHLFNGDQMWKCFGCGALGDVLDACIHMEGRPLSGAGWVNDTLLYLAEQFGIPVEKQTLTEDEQFELDTYRAHAQASRILLTSKKSDLVTEKIKAYGWTEKTLQIFGVGSVSSTQEYLKRMEDAGFSRAFLHQVDLDNPRMFHPDCLVYSVKDERGNTVGFSARNLRYDGLAAAAKEIARIHGEDSVQAREARQELPPKYINSKQTDPDGKIRNSIYQKGKRLFGLHLVRPKATKLWIFEGNADVVTAYNAGLANGVGICSNKLNKDHLELILQQGIKHILFVMDGDDGGAAGVKSFVQLADENLSNRPGIRIELVLLTDGEDPDSFIRAKDLQAFTNLPRVSLFGWRLQHAMEAGEDCITVAREGVHIVVNEPETLQRHAMLMQLAQTTQLPIEVLTRQMEEILCAEEVRSEAQIAGVAERLALQLKRNPRGAASAIAAAAYEVENLSTKSNKGATTQSIQQVIAAIFKEFEATTEVVGLKTGKPLFDSWFGGFPKGAALVSMPGKPHHGKSSILSSFTTGIIDNNPDAIILAHSVDDVLRDYIPRLLGAKYQYPSEYFKVAGKFTHEVEGFKEIFHESDEWLRDVVEAQRLVPMDITLLPGNLTSFEAKVKDLRRSYPSRPIVAIGDNFHLYDADSTSESEGEALTRKMSKRVKAIANTYDVCVVMTMELPKLQVGVKPRLANIKGTAGISYDSSANLAIYNDYQEYLDSSEMVWKGKDDKTRPVVELLIDKSKVLRGFSGSIFYKFHKESGYIEEISETEQAAWLAKSQTVLGKVDNSHGNLKAARLARRNSY